MFNINNWNYSQYINGELKAIINLTAEPTDDAVDFLYSITVLDQIGNEVYQEDFKVLDDACNRMNSKYSEYW